MASNVVVLLPNGKRQTIRTTPMMTLKQIVNAVCEKQKMTDVEKWGLKQNKTTLDLGLSVRFANLAPGAKLDLIRITTQKVHSDVQVALQLDDGGRVIGKFPITSSLWDILIHFENSSQDGSLNLTKRTAPAPKKKNIFKKIGGQSKDTHFYQQPVCLLLNKEYGTIPLLKSTTLQLAGITSGNIALRLLFRPTESSLDDVLNDINTPFQAPNNDIILGDTPVASSSIAPTEPIDESKKIDVERSNSEIHSSVVPTESTDEPLKINATVPTELIERTDAEQSTESTDESSKIDSTAATELIDVEQSTSEIRSSVVPTESTNEPLKIDATAPTDLTERIDVEQSTLEISSSIVPESADELSKMDVEQSTLEIRSSTVPESADEPLKMDVEQNTESMEIDSSFPDQASTTFNSNDDDVIKSSFEQIQPSKNDNESEADQSSVTQTMANPIDQSSDQVCFDRNIKVFNPLPENVQHQTQIDLPDSFYELTASELKFLLAMQNSKRVSQENAGFRTSKVRAREEEEKERKYPKTLIRVRFPDSFQLQIAFMSKETVAKLYEFVKGALRTPHCAFELYTSPPKKVLSDQKLTFFHAELTPASVVYFIWSDKSENGSGPYLSEEYLKLREDIPHIQTMEDVDTSIIPKNLTIKPDDVGHTLSEPSVHHDERPSEKKKSKGSGSGHSIPKWLRRK